MSTKIIDSYQIGLEIAQSDKTQKTIDNLKSAFNDASKSLDEINDSLLESVKGQEDASKEAKAYNDLISKRLSELKKESDILIHSSNEQGKADRERLKFLESESKQRKLNASEMKELKRLQKDVVDLSDEELTLKIKENQEARKKLKATQLEMKYKLSEIKSQKTLKDLVKADLKGISDKIKKQKEFIQTLKTTEGRYNAIKKAAQLSGKVAKAGAKVAAGAVGIVGGIVGGAIAGAENVASSEREARRIKGGFSNDEKNEMVSQLRIKSNADPTAIVDAINRVQNVIKSNNKDDLIRAALAELEFPGASILFQSQTGETKADDYTIFQNRLRKIQAATGAGISDLTGAFDAISNLKDTAFKSGVSQQDLLSLYSALKSSNVYDSDDQITRAMRGFLGQSGLNADNFYEKMNEYQWDRYARGAQNKNQALSFAKTFDFNALKAANRSQVSNVLEQSAAEKAAETARRVSIEKDKLVLKVLETIEPILKNGQIEVLIKKTFELIPKLIELVQPLLNWGMDKLVSVLQYFLNLAENPLVNDESWFSSKSTAKRRQKVLDLISSLFNKDDKNDGNSTESGFLTRQGSVGGVAFAPTLVGERGPEAIIPLDFARSGRSYNIVNNFTQSFNLTGNQTTGLSLGQAVKGSSFTDNLINRRLFGG